MITFYTVDLQFAIKIGKDIFIRTIMWIIIVFDENKDRAIFRMGRPVVG